MRMMAKVTLSQYHPILVEEIRQLLKSWGFDCCGRGLERGWCGLWEASDLKKTVVPKEQSCAAEPCGCRTEMWKCTHKREKAYGMTSFNPFSELSSIYICEDCGVLLGDL